MKMKNKKRIEKRASNRREDVKIKSCTTTMDTRCLRLFGAPNVMLAVIWNEPNTTHSVTSRFNTNYKRLAFRYYILHVVRMYRGGCCCCCISLYSLDYLRRVKMRYNQRGTIYKKNNFCCCFILSNIFSTFFSFFSFFFFSFHLFVALWPSAAIAPAKTKWPRERGKKASESERSRTS